MSCLFRTTVSALLCGRSADQLAKLKPAVTPRPVCVCVCVCMCASACVCLCLCVALRGDRRHTHTAPMCVCVALRLCPMHQQHMATGDAHTHASPPLLHQCSQQAHPAGLPCIRAVSKRLHTFNLDARASDAHPSVVDCRGTWVPRVVVGS